MAAKFCGLGLRGAAGDDDARLRVVAARLADRLPGLAHGLAGDGAGVEDHGAAFQRAEAGAFGLAPHHFGFIGVQPAAEGHDVDAGSRSPRIGLLDRADIRPRFRCRGPTRRSRDRSCRKIPIRRHRSG